MERINSAEFKDMPYFLRAHENTQREKCPEKDVYFHSDINWN